MSNIKDLYDEIVDSEYDDYKKHCEYLRVDSNSTHKNIVSINGNISKFEEILRIENPDSDFERVIVANSPNKKPAIFYIGEDYSEIQNTLNSLKLPNHSANNIGDIVFKEFEYSIENKEENAEEQEEYENRFLKYEIESEKLPQLRTVLNRLAHVYSGRKIDQNFYETLS